MLSVFVKTNRENISPRGEYQPTGSTRLRKATNNTYSTYQTYIVYSHCPSFEEASHCACCFNHARLVLLEPGCGFLLIGCHFWSYLNAWKILALRIMTSSRSLGSITFTSSQALFHLSLFVNALVRCRQPSILTEYTRAMCHLWSLGCPNDHTGALWQSHDSD